MKCSKTASFVIVGLALTLLGACAHQRSNSELRHAEGIAAGMTVARQAFPSGNLASSAVLLETHAPTRVRVGQNYSYEIHVTNLTDGTLAGVTVSDTLQGSFDRVSSEPELSGNSSGRPVWDLGSLEAGETRIIQVNGVARSEGTVISCAEVNWKNAICVATDVVDPRLELALGGPGEANVSQVVTIEYNVQNPGSGEASGVVIDHQLPEGWTAPDGSDVVHIEVGTLAPGQSRQLTAELRPTQSGSYTIEALARSAEGLEARSDPLSVIIAQPELRIAVEAPTSQYLGKEVRYEIALMNIGDGIARGAEIEAQIPAGSTFVSADAGGIAQGDRVVWNGFDVKPMHRSIVSFVVKSAVAGPMECVARGSAQGCEAVASGGSCQIDGVWGILFDVIDLDDPIQVGTNATYQITVTNQGSSISSGITIDCELEDSMSYVTSTGPTQIVQNGNSLSFGPLKGLSPGAQATWTVVVRAESPGDVRFVATLNSDQLQRPVPEAEATHFYR